MKRKGPWEGENDRRPPVFSFPPSFSRKFSSRDRERDVWGEGSFQCSMKTGISRTHTYQTSSWSSWPRKFGSINPSLLNIKELKQQRRWRLEKHHLKSEFTLLQSLSRLFHLVSFDKCWQYFLELNIKVQEKKKKVVVLCSRPRENVKLGTFHDVVLQRRQENVQKTVIHVQSC